MVNIRSHDPLRNFQFRLRLLASNLTGDEGVGPSPPSGYLAGVNRVSGLSATITPTEIWSGGNARHRYAHPDRCTWDAITLDQGLALDGTLAAWAQAVIDFTTTGRVDAAAAPVKRSLVLEVWDPYYSGPPADVQGIAGETTAPPLYPMYRYIIHNAWISRYQAMPQLDAMANEVALLSVEITHEGWRGEAVSPSPRVLGTPSSPLTEPGGPDLFDPFDDDATAIA